MKIWVTLKKKNYFSKEKKKTILKTSKNIYIYLFSFWVCLPKLGFSMVFFFLSVFFNLFINLLIYNFHVPMAFLTSFGIRLRSILFHSIQQVNRSAPMTQDVVGAPGTTKTKSINQSFNRF